jgi:hypothetical protein
MAETASQSSRPEIPLKSEVVGEVIIGGIEQYKQNVVDKIKSRVLNMENSGQGLLKQAESQGLEPPEVSDVQENVEKANKQAASAAQVSIEAIKNINSAETSQPSPLPELNQDVTIAGQQWRVMSVSDKTGEVLLFKLNKAGVPIFDERQRLTQEQFLEKQKPQKIEPPAPKPRTVELKERAAKEAEEQAINKETEETMDFTKAQVKTARQTEQKAQKEQLADQNLTTQDLLKAQSRMQYGEKQAQLLDKEAVKKEMGPMCDALRDKIVLGHLLNPDDTKREHDEAAITEMVGLLKGHGYAGQESDKEVEKYCRGAYSAMKATIAKEASLPKSDKSWWKNPRTYNSLLLAAAKGSVYFTLGGITTAFLTPFLTPLAGAATVGGLRVLDTYLTNKLIKEKDIKRHKKELAQQKAKVDKDGNQVQPSASQITTDNLLSLIISQKQASLQPKVQGQDVEYYKNRYLNTMKVMGPETADLSAEKAEKSAQALAIFEALDDKLEQRQEEIVKERESQNPGLWGRFTQAVNKARNSEFLRVINGDGLDEMSRAVSATTASVGIGLALRQAALRVPGLKIALGAWAGYRTGKLVEKLTLGKGAPEMIINQNLASLNTLSAQDNYQEYLDKLGQTKSALASLKITNQNRLNAANWQKEINQATMNLALATIEKQTDKDLAGKLDVLQQDLAQSQKAGLEQQSKISRSKKLKQAGIRAGFTAAGAVLGAGVFNDEIAKALGFLEHKASQYAGDIKEAASKIDLSSSAGAAELPAGAAPLPAFQPPFSPPAAEAGLGAKPSLGREQQDTTSFYNQDVPASKYSPSKTPDFDTQNIGAQNLDTQNVDVSKSPVVSQDANIVEPSQEIAAKVVVENKAAPSPGSPTAKPIETIETPNLGTKNVNISKFPEAEYQGGNSIWQEADKQLSVRFKEQFENLGSGDPKTHKLLEIYNTDRVKDTIVAHPEKYGLPANINFNKMSEAQIKGLDWDKAFHDTFVKKGLSTSLTGEHLPGLGGSRAPVESPAIEPSPPPPPETPNPTSPKPDAQNLETQHLEISKFPNTPDVEAVGYARPPEVVVENNIPPASSEATDMPANPARLGRPAYGEIRHTYKDQLPVYPEHLETQHIETQNVDPSISPNVDMSSSPNVDISKSPEVLESLPADAREITKIGYKQHKDIIDQWLSSTPKEPGDALLYIGSDKGNLTLFKDTKTGELFYNTDPNGASKNHDYIFDKAGHKEANVVYIISEQTKNQPQKVLLVERPGLESLPNEKTVYVVKKTGRIFDSLGKPLSNESEIGASGRRGNYFYEITSKDNKHYQIFCENGAITEINKDAEVEVPSRPTVEATQTSQTSSFANTMIPDAPKNVSEPSDTPIHSTGPEPPALPKPPAPEDLPTDIGAALANPKSWLSLIIEANKDFVNKFNNNDDDGPDLKQVKDFMAKNNDGHLGLLQKVLDSGQVPEGKREVLKTQIDLFKSIKEAITEKQ